MLTRRSRAQAPSICTFLFAQFGLLSSVDTTSRSIRRRLLPALLAAACLLAVSASSVGALSFEWDGAPIAVPNAGSIGTDAAGRIYVPLRGAGKVGNLPA